MHDVDVEPLEEAAQLQHEARGDGVDRLRGVAVEGHADAEAHDLERRRRTGRASSSAIGGVRSRWPVTTVTSCPRRASSRA